MRLVVFILLLVYSVLGGSKTIMSQTRIDGHQHLLQRRPSLAERDTNFLRQSFLMMGTGAEAIIYNGYKDAPLWGMTTKLGIGRWYNSISGIRFGAEGTVYQRVPFGEVDQRLIRVGATIDYMLRISALGVGYNPYRFFNLSLYGGIGAHMSMSDTKVNDVYSLRMGLISSFRLSPFSAFYIEPGISLYTDNVDFHTNWRDYSIAPSITAGLWYRMVPHVERREQKPWEGGRFFENTFIMFGGGSEVLLTRNLRNSFRHPGYNVRIGVGKRFTPVSGLRIAAIGGRSYLDDMWLSSVRGSLDYMLNLNALAYGNVNRTRVGVALTLGPTFSYSKYQGKSELAYGGGTGILATFRLSPGTQFFIEPRISILTNTFAYGSTHKYFDALTELTAGFVFHRYAENIRMQRYDYAVDNYKGKLRVDGKHVFLQASGGVQTAVSEKVGKHQYQPIVRGSLGYWINPVSGFRANGQLGLLAEKAANGEYMRTKTVATGVDYMFNLTNAMRGYVPGRKTELIATVGGEMLYNTQRAPQQERFNYGVSAGVEGVWNFAQNLSLFTGPRVTLYTPDVVLGDTRFIGGDLLASWTLGMNYRFQPYNKMGSRDAHAAGKRSGYFITLGGGTNAIITESPRNWEFGAGFMLAIGNRFTPVSSWRMGIRSEVIPEVHSYKNGGYAKYVGLEANYLMSIMTLADGYKENRCVDVMALIGASTGWSHSAHQFNFVPGAHAGAQATLRLSKSTSLYVEPRISVYGEHYENYNNRNFDLAVNAMAGINYKFLYSDKGTHNELFGKGSFISFGAGTGIFINRFNRKEFAQSLTMNYNLQVGKWHTPVSGTRIGVYHSSVNFDTRGSKHFDLRSCGVHAGYLLNVSSLLRQKQKVLSLIALAEVGVDKSKYADFKHWVPSVTAGGQALFHLTPKVGLYAEARGVMYGDNMLPYKPSIKAFAAFQTMLGVSRKF
ncbi:MAG: hypothetical protein ACRDDZ_09790 [Marinifilaceae bacterium]